MAQWTNYDPGKISVVFKGITAGGFQKGTFVKIKRDEATYKKEKGSQGDGVRTRTRNNGGQIVLTLQGTSPTNAAFYAILRNGERNGANDFGASTVKDLNQGIVARSANSWLMQPADVEFSDEHTPREWTIDCDDLDFDPNGSIA